MAKPKLGSEKKASNQMTLMNLTAGKWVSQAIAVAAELGIPDLLKDRPRTAAEIARTASASKDGVYRLLRALASVGLFAEAGNSGSLPLAGYSAQIRPKRSAAMRDS